MLILFYVYIGTVTDQRYERREIVYEPHGLFDGRIQR